MNDNEQKKYILFVDDDKNVLDGLRRDLFCMNDQWLMKFVISGEEALATLQERSYDVIISDMRMPTMDGAELLQKVKALYPDTIRFILSGNSDKDMIMRTISATDQFITKPCDGEQIIEIISDALKAQNPVNTKKIEGLFSQFQSIPTLPQVYIELMTLLKSNTSNIEPIAEIVGKDITILAKVLQLVNSAFFGLKQTVNDVKRAILFLGVETLKSIILTANLFSQFSEKEMAQFSIGTLYDHCFRVELIARKIALSLTDEKEIINAAGTAGMLHDIGKLLLIRNKPKEYSEIYEQVQQGGKSLIDLERDYFGFSHAEIGGYLLTIWGLPKDIVDAIFSHHQLTELSDSSFNSYHAVYIANILDHEESNNLQDQEGIPGIDKESLTKMNCIQYVPEWKKIAHSIKEPDLD